MPRRNFSGLASAPCVGFDASPVAAMAPADCKNLRLLKLAISRTSRSQDGNGSASHHDLSLHARNDAKAKKVVLTGLHRLLCLANQIWETKSGNSIDTSV